MAAGALAMSIFLVGGADNVSAQQSDTKLWAGFTGRVELLEPLRLDINHQQRLSSELGKEKSLTEFELRLRALEILRLSAAYRTIATNDDGFWHRAMLNLGAAYGVGQIGLAYRLRLQSTVRSNETVSAIRNKISADYDLDGPLTPSAAFELHYQSTDSEFREVRFQAGVEYKMSKKIRLGAFYMFQSEFNKRVGESNHVLRLGITYVFRRVKKSKNSVREEADIGDTVAD